MSRRWRVTRGKRAGMPAVPGLGADGGMCRATGAVWEGCGRVKRYWMTWALCLSALGACAPQPGALVSKGSVEPQSMGLPPTESLFHPDSGAAPQRPNDQIAQDFLDLEFHMESGQSLQRLTRFEGPVTYRLTGAVPASAPREMAALVARLRQEAGIDIRAADAGAEANLTVEFAPKSTLKRLEPRASCFVAPNVGSLAEFRRGRALGDLSWQGLLSRERVAIFVPSDTSPQEVRDCLHEETAQALGPLNDLYRLPDSVFNDDNFQSVLTPFDMLMLRLHHAPELHSGMAAQEVAARLPGLVAALNPSGQYPGGWAEAETPRSWTQAVETALGPGAPSSGRMAAAGRMLQMALERGWTDNRLGFAWFVMGRLQAATDPLAAERSYAAAARVYAGLPDDGVHLSHALMQLAAIALATGRPERAMELSDQALPLARRAENAALLANLLLIKAESLTLLGRTAEAEALRLDLAPAARYGFGSTAAIQARAAEIAALATRG